jgi:hypothetical protein
VNTQSSAPSAPARHQVHKALHLPLVTCGIDRGLFWGSLVAGVVAYEATMRLAMGVLVIGALWIFGRWSIARDPHMLFLLWQSQHNRRRYDSAKGHPEALESTATVMTLR